MKKMIVICVLGALDLSAYAQGLVTIDTTAFTISTNSTDLEGGTTGRISSAANSYYFELLVMSDPTGSTTTPTDPSLNGEGVVAGIANWDDSGVSGTNGTGIAAGHINAILGNPGVAANSWAVSATNFFIVVGWSANLGSSWSQVLPQAESGDWNIVNTFFGISSVGYGASVGLAPGFSVFGSNLGQVGGFTLNDLEVLGGPEPTTMGLVGVGVASLLLFRRKK